MVRLPLVKTELNMHSPTPNHCRECMLTRPILNDGYRCKQITIISQTLVLMLTD